MLDVSSSLLNEDVPGPAEHHVPATVFLVADIPGFSEDLQLRVASRLDLRYRDHGVSIRTTKGRVFVPWPNVAAIVTQVEGETGPRDEP